MTMLELSAVDLDALGEALEDHSDFTRWFVDPETGEVEPWSEDLDEPHPEERGALYVQPIPSYEAYGDLEAFVSRGPGRGRRTGLAGATGGRGPSGGSRHTFWGFP